MICPLLRAANAPVRRSLTGQEFEERSECREAACAWWVPEADACAVRALVVELNLAREERNQKIDAYEGRH